MKRQVLAILVCAMGAVNFTSAENIRGINMDFVTIGHAGNAADTRGAPGCGAVGYNYRIGKYEVTNAQWNAFTAVAGAPTGSDGGYSLGSKWTGVQQPTDRVSWYEAAQFCNYLTTGDKSKGAYQFSGTNANPGAFGGINRAAAISTYGTIYVIPTDDEWYKAAYFKSDGSGYSLYANGTDTAPVADVDTNYNQVINSTWNVGTGTMEQNGTYDMMGNACEWNETLFYGSYRGNRGGGIYDAAWVFQASYSGNGRPYIEAIPGGFRVASVPEPAALLLLGLGGMMIRKFKHKS